MGTSTPRPAPPSSSAWGRPRPENGSGVWPAARCVFPQHPDHLPLWPSGSKEGSRPGTPLSDLTWGVPCPAGSRVARPQGLLDKPCFTLRLDDQPKADVSEDHEVEVSDGDTRAVDGASLSSLPGSARGGVWECVGCWLWRAPSPVPTCCSRRGQCARQREQ